jgi:hypothetical protein
MCGGAAVLWAVLGPCVARAAELTWTAPETCPSAEQGRRALEDAIGEPLAKAEPLGFDVLVELESDGTARATVTMREPALSAGPKQRVIVAKSCSEAADAAVVAMALALASGRSAEPDSAASTGSEGSAPRGDGNNERAARPTPARRPAPGPRTSEASGRPSTPSSAVRVSSEASFVLDSGSLPVLAAGAEVGVSVGWRQVGARLSGVVLPSGSATVKGDAGADFMLFAGSVAVCGRTHGTVFLAETCAGSELGRLSGSGYGVTDQRNAASWWVAPRADLTLRMRIAASWAGFLRGVVAVPRVRDRFKLNNVGPVHQADPAIWRLGMGLWFDL